MGKTLPCFVGGTMSLYSIIFTVVCATLVLADPRAEFEKFKVDHGKRCTSLQEEEARFTQFKENLVKIEKHNSEAHSWKLGVTKFADLSKEEFVAKHASGHLQTLTHVNSSNSLPRRDIKLEDLPSEVDWRQQGVITSVRDQGMCGSCWAFASASAMASYAKINDMDHDLLELSAQHIVSCAPNPLKCGGTGGCMGSIEPLAFVYASLFGVVTEEEYPYESQNGGFDDICRFDAPQTDVSVMTMGFETLPHNDAAALMNHLATKGPLSASVAASDWSAYRGGVFDGCDYDSNMVVNHAVTLVGYGTDPSEGDFWLIKNSWGTSWGEDGYIRLRRQATPQCAIDSSPLDGSGCVEGGVESVEVCGTCAVVSDNSYPLGTTFMN